MIHFIGRNGGRPDGAVPDAITGLQDWERLANILGQQRINAHPVFGTASPVVCFTESTLPAVRTLIGDGRYTACGIGFSKDFVFARGGGPCFYVRGDLWPSVNNVPVELRPFLTRYWPAAVPGDGEPPLPWHLANESQWPHEREWRVVGAGAPPSFEFGWPDIRFLITPSASGSRSSPSG